MKKTAAVLALLLIAAAIFAFAACTKDPGQEAAASDVPVITESPDGEVTAGPTATPEAEGGEPDSTDVPIVTEFPGVTAGPTATPETPEYTNVPVVTEAPGVTAGPTATPETPAYTNVPIVTAAPAVTAGPTATPYVPKTTPKPGATAAPTAKPTEAAPGTPTQKPTSAPTAAPTSAPTAQPDEPDVPHPDQPNDYYVSYAGDVTDLTGAKVGDTFYWVFSLANEKSCLYAGHWLVDFDERYVEPQSCSQTWQGRILSMINAAWDDEEATSDKPLIFYNADYTGMTGQNPYGEAGNRYTVIGLSITTFEYGGVQAKGGVLRVKYQIKAIPPVSVMHKDSGGYYLPMTITVRESKAMLTATTCVTHGRIDVEHGKLYFKH